MNTHALATTSETADRSRLNDRTAAPSDQLTDERPQNGGESTLAERAAYFPVPGAHLYTVLHPVEQPIARVLLIGPFAAERHSSYIPWVNWARYLAQKGIEVLRYDYRGVGESLGAFDQMSFADWSQDVYLLGNWLADRSPKVPLVLHGLGVGALLASLAFDAGQGDVLLLWSPPESAKQALRSALVRWINVEQLFKYGDERKPASVFIQQLEQGHPVDVEGYQWSGKLWKDSLLFHLPAAIQDETTAREEYKRPVRIVKLGREASPLVKAGTVADDRAKDFTWLFSDNWQWIAASVDITRSVQ
jgi:hypothetical protein